VLKDLPGHASQAPEPAGTVTIEGLPRWSVEIASLVSFAARAGSAEWNRKPVDVPRHFPKVPTMLTPEEAQMLTWLARYRPLRQGAVVDLGTFLGGSTSRLALGVQAEGHIVPIHGYDRFEIDKKRQVQFLGAASLPLLPGLSSLELVQGWLGPLGVELHPGDFAEAAWNGGTISLLHVDIAKGWDLNDVIVQRFFPFLAPGSVVVQQDFYFPQTPWLQLTMHRLRRSVVRIGGAQKHSCVYLVIRPLAEDDLALCLRRNVTESDVIGALDATIEEHAGDEVHLAPLRDLRERYVRNPKADFAWQY